ncbi:hypothetical protein [Robiginitalea sp. SC105]|uniref:hypothetical protein n=1 Tax=Robiginitalea sp. SC105 TaxID=2762332 RepID=UPI00163AB93A|nr:hypothetical protein [Robiginitalea sp. SC105]MBC2839257.1 hypothetical protein [Robiginitalea sp. SC105]
MWTALIACLLLSCGGPRERDYQLSATTTQPSNTGDVVLDLHEVRVSEVLPADNYWYLQVNEGDRVYWIATRTGNATKGGTYFYNEAVQKKNFESPALGRVFDTLYLVTRLVTESERSRLRKGPPNPHALQGDRSENPVSPEGNPEKVTRIGIHQLLKSPEEHAGSWVEVTGICTKVNSGIMGRNWVHLRDPDEESAELVLTTGATTEAGQTVTFRARVSLNRDFGAGYRYDILLEDGLLLH